MINPYLLIVRTDSMSILKYVNIKYLQSYFVPIPILVEINFSCLDYKISIIRDLGIMLAHGVRFIARGSYRFI